MQPAELARADSPARQAAGLDAGRPGRSIIVSTNEGKWLEACLPTVFAAAGGVDARCRRRGQRFQGRHCELVESGFPQARVVDSRNRGFAHGNNRGMETTTARYVLFLNPDTEVVDGTFGDLVATLDARPDIGLVGVRQLTPDGELFPTIRRFPSAPRALGDALRSERWPIQPSWSGERILDPEAYEREQECDWTSGSYMLARREALQSAGFLDERFFIYSEEPDLCRRIKRDGWKVLHLPDMTIVHHACKGGIRPKMIAQDAYTRRQYARKHFQQPQRGLFLAAILARHVVRAIGPGSQEQAKARRAAARRAIKTLCGFEGPPFGPPPKIALAPVDDG